MANIHKYPYGLYFQAIQPVPYRRVLGLLLLKYSRGDCKITVKSVYGHTHTHTHINTGHRDYFIFSEMQDLPKNSKPKSV